MIKKLLVPVLCVLLGCAGGAAMGSVTAQTWPETPSAPRWQQECVGTGGATPGAERRNANEELRLRGAAGWEAFAFSPHGDVCFKRPAP
jgi:hypothetical protein